MLVSFEKGGFLGSFQAVAINKKNATFELGATWNAALGKLLAS